MSYVIGDWNTLDAGSIMSSQPKSLKLLVIMDGMDAVDISRVARHAEMWNTLCVKQQTEMLQLISSIYFQIMDHYVATRMAMPMAQLGRLYNKRLGTIRKNAGIATLEMRDFVVCIGLSKTAPLSVATASTGGAFILPTIAVRTYFSRVNKGEQLPDAPEFLTGQAAGPELNPAGLREGYAPFVSDEQKIDTAPKFARPEDNNA